MARKVKIILVHNYFSPIKDPMSILALLIQRFTNTYYNHCEILIEENGQLFVIGAVYPRVRKLTFSKWANQLERSYQIYDIDSTRTDQEMIDFINGQVGKKYDLASLLFFIPFYLLIKAWFNKKYWIGRRSNKSNRRPYCYELAALTAGWEDCYNITPNEVIKRLAA